MPFLNRERERGHPQTKGVVDSRLRVPLVRVASARRRRSRRGLKKDALSEPRKRNNGHDRAAQGIGRGRATEY